MSNVFQNIQLERIADAMQGGGSSVTVNIDVTGAGDMQGATASAAGVHGLVPAPAVGDENKVLSGAGTWIDAGAGSVAELGDLEDVELTSPTSGEILKYDGSKWVNGTGAGDMQGATASAAGVHGLVPAPAAGDEHKVLSGAGTWIDAGSDVAELGDLEDVDLTSPTSGESLKYDGTKWVNGNVTAELPDFIEETSGSIVTVEASERPAKSLVVAINPVQSGSGDPSPENVRPISGWTGAKIYRTGTNVWDKKWEIGGISANNGQNTSSTERIRSVNYISVMPNTDYYYKGITNFRVFFYDVNKNFIEADGTATANRVITTPANCRYIRFIIVSNTMDDGISINYPSTDTEYHAYTGQDYTIHFPTEAGTVYGGTLDVVNGVLTVDRAMVDLGTLRWRMSGEVFYAVLEDLITGVTSSEPVPLVCSSYATAEKVGGANVNDKQIGTGTAGGVSNSNIIVKDLSYTDIASFKDAMSGVQLVYELSTPQIYQLTPTVVQMLLGTNNIWADTGEVKELKYIPQTYNDLLKEVSGGISYSLAEQDTGLKWIDGSTIYQRTFDISGATYSQDQYIEIATVPNIALLISAECVVYEGSTGTLAPEAFQRIHVTGTGAIEIYCTTSSWNLTAGSHLTIRYTKSVE